MQFPPGCHNKLCEAAFLSFSIQTCNFLFAFPVKQRDSKNIYNLPINRGGGGGINE